jgi:hypothetical protein
MLHDGGEVEAELVSRAGATTGQSSYPGKGDVTLSAWPRAKEVAFALLEAVRLRAWLLQSPATAGDFFFGVVANLAPGIEGSWLARR